jgi:oligopeptidase B
MPHPPAAERRPHEITAHGDTRVDDWYWLRDKDDPAVLALLEEENAYTKAATARLDPLVEEIYQQILSHTKLTDVTYPAPRGDWAYYVRTEDGLQHAISCRRPRTAPLPVEDRSVPDDHETVVLDENLLAEGHEYLEVGDQALSHDQRLLAYATDTTGSELMTLRIRDLESGQDLADVIEGTYYGLAWSSDGKTLFYTRPDETLRPYQVWRHRLGSPTGADAKVWEEEDERYFVGVGNTKDDRYVAIQSESSLTSEWRLVPAAEPETEPVVVEPRRHDRLYSLEHHDGELLICSNEDAVNFALYRAPVASPSRDHWRLLLAEREDVRIEGFDVIDGYALVEERGHATTAIRLLPLREDGDPVVIPAPAAGTVALAQNLDFRAGSVRYQTTSLVEPRTLHELDLATGEHVRLWAQTVPGYDPAAYRTEQRWATSHDGTPVAITLAWRADRPAGPGPALLYGYGAYGISTDPGFSTARPSHPLLDRGVVYAIAHVRGGEELGRHWYLDGKFAKKPNTFHDFLSAARFLVADGWTTPEQLCCLGGSAGGLLVGATVNLDPSAFGAAVAEVPFVDCLTTMLDPSLPLTTNEWEEWGDPVSDPEAYGWIKSYSPYDNIRPEHYPRMLVTGGISDPRVGYFEPAKWVQKLRCAHPDNRDRILLRMELSAGHFGPSGRYEAWRRQAFVMAFVLDAIGAGGSPAPQPGANVTS